LYSNLSAEGIVSFAAQSIPASKERDDWVASGFDQLRALERLTCLDEGDGLKDAIISPPYQRMAPIRQDTLNQQNSQIEMSKFSGGLTLSEMSSFSLLNSDAEALVYEAQRACPENDHTAVASKALGEPMDADNVRASPRASADVGIGGEPPTSSDPYQNVGTVPFERR
jgi:hypothetical protein